jgi:hypothetical protein
VTTLICQTCAGPIEFETEAGIGPFLVGRNGFVHLNGALGHNAFPRPVRLAHTAWKPGAAVTVTAVGEVVLEVQLPDGRVSSAEFDETTDRDQAFAQAVGDYLDCGYQLEAAA